MSKFKLTSCTEESQSDIYDHKCKEDQSDSKFSLKYVWPFSIQGLATTVGSTFQYALRLIAIDLGHKMGHSEHLEHVIYKAEYITWTV